MNRVNSILERVFDGIFGNSDDTNSSHKSGKEKSESSPSHVESHDTIDTSLYNSRLIEESLHIDCSNPLEQINVYCPYRKANIICGSIYIDKLSDLTKFIITSMYDGETIDNIQALTQMGEKTIKEEIEYLKKGKLIKPNVNELTPLGNDYGRLILLFQKLSSGISVYYNSYTDRFEEEDDITFYETTNDGVPLSDSFSPVLIRNDNYSNSKGIAIDHLEQNIPFCSEVRESIYTTIQIIDSTPKYRKFYLKQINKGYVSSSSSSIQISFPVDIIDISPKILEIDEYRTELEKAETLHSEYPELFSKKGHKLFQLYSIEKDIDTICIIVNAATGEVCTKLSSYCFQEKERAIALQPRTKYSIELKENTSHYLYLKRLKTKRKYLTFYYPFYKLEKEA